MQATCPWCQAPQAAGPSCPRCGANYAKAAQIKALGKAAASAPPGEPAVLMTAPLTHAAEPPLVADPLLEWKFCVAALPTMLTLAVLFHAFEAGHFLQRTFLSMPVHELGHALMSWWCGYFAIPTLWKTITFEERGLLTPLLLAAGLIAMVVRARFTPYRGLVPLGIGLLIVQGVCTVVLSDASAQALITFAGDGGAMVLGTALMCSFYFGKSTQLHRGSLRWGFMAIGAAAFVDAWATWWAARTDPSAIPYGEIEGVGLSDPSKLVEVWGWTEKAMVNRYVGLGLLCLIVLIAVWGWGVRVARTRVNEFDRPATGTRF